MSPIFPSESPTLGSTLGAGQVPDHIMPGLFYSYGEDFDSFGVANYYQSSFVGITHSGSHQGELGIAPPSASTIFGQFATFVSGGG